MVTNFYKVIPKSSRKTYYNPDPLMPQHPFRLCISGATGTGKTNLLLNIIERCANFTKIYLYAKKLDEPLYEFLIKHYSKVDENLITCSNDIADVISPDDIDEKHQTLIIFDDMICEANLKSCEELFIRGRKQNASIAFLSQSYFHVPKSVRLNSDYFIFLRINDKREIIEIKKGQIIPDFENKIIQYTRKPYDFLMLDLKTLDPSLRFRHNFGEE